MNEGNAMDAKLTARLVEVRGRLLELKRCAEAGVDEAETIKEGANQLAEVRDYVDDLTKTLIGERTALQQTLCGTLQPEALSVAGLLDGLNEGYKTGNQGGPNSIDTLVSAILELAAVSTTGASDLSTALAGVKAKIHELTKDIDQSSALDTDGIDELVGQFTTLTEDSRAHLEELSEAPLNTLLEEIDNFGDEFLEGPAAEILGEFDALESVVDTVEENALNELERIMEILVPVSDAVALMKQIQVT